MLWALEGTFRVDHPVVSEQWSEPGSKGFRLSEELQVSMKVELAVMKGAFERLSPETLDRRNGQSRRFLTRRSLVPELRSQFR
jgi:hypothetical protein